MSVVDSIALIDRYEEHIPFFVDNLLNINKRKKYSDQLKFGEVIQNSINVGTKKGNKVYHTWKTKKINAYNILLEDVDNNETAFSKLRKSLEGITVFDKIKMTIPSKLKKD